MYQPIPTIPKHWYVLPSLIFIAASTAAWVVVAYAPEFVVWWLK